MRIPKKYFAYPVLTLFLLYGLNPEFFERTFFLNELLALTGLLALFIHIRRGNRLLIPRSRLYIISLCVLLLGCYQLVASWPVKTSLYFYLRNSVIVYSVFSFFLGYYSLHYYKQYLQSLRLLLRLLAPPVILSGSLLILDRFSGAVFFPFLFRRLTLPAFALLLLFNVVYAVTFESLTVVLITFILAGVVLVRRYVLLRMGLSLAVVGFAVALTYFSPSIELYHRSAYHLFGNTRAVQEAHPLLKADPNSTWRLILWYRTIVEDFPRNLTGIGLGTPLFRYKYGVDTAESEHDDEHDSHVMGVHNTYITVFGRLGIVYVLLLVASYHVVFKEFYQYQSYYNAREELMFFIAFFTISVIGLFNLVLESPIYASIYWTMLGFVARAIYERQQAAGAGQLSAEPAAGLPFRDTSGG